MDASGSTAIIVAMVALVGMSAFFSASETSFTCLNKVRLKGLANEGNQRAERTLQLAENYDKLLSTILIGNNIVNILSASLASLLFVRWLGDAGVSVSTVVMTVVVLMFGEISPKSIAKKRSEALAMAFTPILSAMMKLMSPLNWLSMHWQMLVDRLFRPMEDHGFTDEEIMTIVEEAEHEGDIDSTEGELIRSAIEFYDLTAEDILTPRVDLVAADIDDTSEKIESLFCKSGFSRLPIYEDSVDNIVGVLHEKDFFLNRHQKSIRDMMTAPVCVMPTVRIPVLLRLLQKTKSHMAVVMDEYGGVNGIVTMEDILEELVGEIWDEHDEVIEEFKQLPDGSYRISCSANLDEMLERFHIDREYDSVTVSGWVLEEMGRFPHEGDSFQCENMLVTVERVDKRRVLQIRVELLTPDENSAHASLA